MINLLFVSILVFFSVYGQSHEVDQKKMELLSKMDPMISACFSLDLDNDKNISDHELGFLSDFLGSWGRALEVRKACRLLMNDLYLSNNRAVETLPELKNAEVRYYVINLEKSKDRLARTKDFFHKAQLIFTRIDAVYGKELNLSILVQDGLYKPYPHHNRYLKPAEVGVYLSQRKAWKKILKDKVSYGVIFEDDVEIPSNLQIQVNKLIREAPKDWSILYLGCNSENKDSFFDGCRLGHAKKAPGASVVELNGQCVAGSWAYIVKKSAAENLLANTLPIEWPIDYAIKNDFVANQKYGSFKAYCASPEIAKTGTYGGSVIGDRGQCSTIECND